MAESEAIFVGQGGKSMTARNAKKVIEQQHGVWKSISEKSHLPEQSLNGSSLLHIHELESMWRWQTQHLSTSEICLSKPLKKREGIVKKVVMDVVLIKRDKVKVVKEDVIKSVDSTKNKLRGFSYYRHLSGFLFGRGKTQ